MRARRKFEGTLARRRCEKPSYFGLNFATTIDLYSHVLPCLKREAAEHMDRILKPVVVNEVVKTGEPADQEHAKSKEGFRRGEWIRTTDLPVPNQEISITYEHRPLKKKSCTPSIWTLIGP